MRTYRVVGLVLIVGFLLTIWAVALAKAAPIDFAAISKKYAKENAASKKKIEQRRALWKMWQTAINDIAKRTGDPEAKQVVEFAEQHLYVVSPTATGIFVHGTITDRDYIGLVPVVAGDDQLPLWKEILQTKSIVAQYTERSDGMRLLWLREGFSQRAKRYVGQHEVYHAIQEKRNRESPVLVDRFFVERDAWDFEHRLIVKDGGKPMAELRDDVVRFIRPKIKNLQGDRMTFPGGKVLWKSSYVARLGKMWGPAKSEHEMVWRTNRLFALALFHLIEREYKGDVRRRQAEVTRAIDPQSR